MSDYSREFINSGLGRGLYDADLRAEERRIVKSAEYRDKYAAPRKELDKELTIKLSDEDVERLKEEHDGIHGGK